MSPIARVAGSQITSPDGLRIPSASLGTAILEGSSTSSAATVGWKRNAPADSGRPFSGQSHSHPFDHATYYRGARPHGRGSSIFDPRTTILVPRCRRNGVDKRIDVIATADSAG